MRNNKGQFKKGFTYREEKPFWCKEWLVKEYVDNCKSALQISKEQNCHENNIFFWLRKHKIKSRTMAEVREIKHWGQSGSDNPMWNRKCELNPRWLGGVTPERQSFYISQEWKKVCSMVWKRDKAVCIRCGIKKETDMPFHIHHIRSFSDKELRADINNLVLLCEACHQWVHSKGNKNNDYIQ